MPESLGGAGASAREAAVVMEEIGRAVAPVPFLSSAVLATVALLRAGDTETVSALARGELTAALVVPLSTAPGDPVAGVSVGGRRADRTGQQRRRRGARPTCWWYRSRAADGLELHTVSRAAAGVEVSPLLALDMTRPLANVRFSGAASSRVGPADEAVAEALETGAALLASEQLGVAQWCFDTTLAYAKQRKQFGRAIGSYQAIKHRLGRSVVRGRCGDGGRAVRRRHVRPETTTRAIAAAIAQAYCSGIAVHAAEECVQLHGGIGMTWEYPAHLYLKRAKSDQLALGTAYRHRARLAELVDLPRSRPANRVAVLVPQIEEPRSGGHLSALQRGSAKFTGSISSDEWPSTWQTSHRRTSAPPG